MFDSGEPSKTFLYFLTRADGRATWLSGISFPAFQSLAHLYEPRPAAGLQESCLGPSLDILNQSP